MPISMRSKMTKKPKPNEYPERILKALVREYDRDVKVRSYGITEATLAVKAGVFDDYTEEIIPNKKWTHGPFELEMHATIRVLEDAKYVTVEDSGADRLIKPTYEGLVHARWLMRPWIQEVWDYHKGDIRTTVFAVIAALLTTLLIHWIFQLVGW